MDRAKRIIVKPARFQTTSSDEAPIRRKMDNTKVRNIDDIENDINDLRTLADKDPLDFEDGSQNQYSPPVDTLVQPRSNASTCDQYLPPTCSQYVTLQPPVHAQHRIYSSQPSSSSNMHQMQLSTSTNMHTIPYKHDQAHQLQPNQKTQPNLTMHINESQYDIDNKNVHGRLDNMETQLRKINNAMEQILKHLQSNDKRRKAP